MMRVKRERGERSERGEPSRVNDNVAAENVNNAEGTLTGALSQMPYTPEMENPDRRLLRSRYRELRTHVNDQKGKLAQADFTEFKAIVDRAEKLHVYVRKPREQIADAELLSDITSELLAVAKAGQAKGGMSAAEFVGAIIHTYGLPESLDGDPVMDWEALGLEACAVFRHAPGMSTMVGPMDVELKVRKILGPRRRERPTEKTRPENVEEADADRPNTETDANMTTMFKILIERQECQLDHLVMNRLSFAQTIENLFALSFLVKDGRVEFKFDENGSQLVVPRNAPAHADRASGHVLNTQFVFRLDFQCWRLMQETVAEDEELMPHRGRGEPSPEAPVARTPIRKNSRNRARETPVAAPAGNSPEDGSGEGSLRVKRRMF